MCTFTDDDVDKPVVNGNGEEVGVVASIAGDVAHVRPSIDAVDSVKSSIGWEAVADVTRPLDSASVREITDEVVRLESELPTEDTQTAGAAETDPTAHGAAAGEPETDPTDGPTGLEKTEVAEELREETDEESLDRGLEVDPTELVDGDREPGTPTGVSVDPGADRERTDAAVETDDERQLTDAAFEPTDEPRRADADGEGEKDGNEESDAREGSEE